MAGFGHIGDQRAQQDPKKTTEDASKQTSGGGGGFARFGLPSEPILKNGVVQFWKLFPCPINAKEALALNVATKQEVEAEPDGIFYDFFYRKQCHPIGPIGAQRLMVCPGESCFQTKGAPCQESVRIFREIKPLKEDARSGRLSPSAAEEYAAMFARAMDLKSKDWDFYTSLNMTPAIDQSTGQQVMGSIPCFNNFGLCPVHGVAGANAAKCLWEDICAAGPIRIVNFKFIPQGKGNPGWKLHKTWNEDLSVRSSVFSAAPAKDGQCHSSLIRAERTGEKRNTDYDFKVKGPYIIDKRVMSDVIARLEGLTMDQIITPHITYSMEEMVKAVGSSTVETAETADDDGKVPFDEPAGRPATSGFGSFSGDVDSRPQSAPAVPQTQAAELEKQICDPNKIWKVMDDMLGVELPVCFGRHNPAAWPKCRATNAPEALCPILDTCRRETEIKGVPGTDAPPAPVAVESIDEWFKKRGLTKPRCFASKKDYGPGKNRNCVACEAVKGADVVKKCGDEIARQGA